MGKGLRRRKAMGKRLWKRILAGLLAASLVFTMAPQRVYASGIIGDDYPAEYKNKAQDTVIDRWRFWNRECTSFVAWRLNSQNGVGFTNYYLGPQWGNAGNWGNVARRLGITVDNTPAVGAVWWSSRGHVAWVAAVNGNKVTIEEYNYDYTGTYQCRENILASTATGYIHIKDIAPDIVPDPDGPDLPNGGTRTICDGDYHIVTALDNSMGLDIPGASSDDCANVQIYHNIDDPLQIFTVTWLGPDKGYQITNKHSGKCLDVEGINRKSGANVFQHEYNGGVNQQWAINEVDNGAYYTIQSRCGSHFVDVKDALAQDGTNVQMWKGNGNTAQKWRFVPAGTQAIPDGDYYIMTDVAGDMCLDAAVRADGDDNAVIARKTGRDSQIYTVSCLADGFYKIIHKSSGKSLDVYEGIATRGANVCHWSGGYNGGHNQQWTFSEAGGGSYYIQPRCSGQYLDVANGQTAENTNVWTTVWMGGEAAQRWKFVPAGKEKLALPVSSIPSGTEVEPGTTVSLSCGVSGASIFYTLDGTAPTVKSIRYVNPIAIEKATVILAYAAKDGYRDSDTAVFRYTVKKSTDPVDPVDPVDPIDPVKPGNPEEPQNPEPSEDTENQGDGLWIAGINQAGYPYTGEALRPAVRVYDKNTLLTEKTDYTIAYKNNTKAGRATITVTGKGNYSGKESVDFDILPIDVGSEEVYAVDFCVKTSKKVQRPIPALYYMGTRMKSGRDFTITYANASNIYAQTGEYRVTVTGKGNYTGTRDLKLTAVEKVVNPKPVSIAKAVPGGFTRSFTYTGEDCTQKCTLTVRTAEGVKTLAEGTDYTVQYANNRKVGTATVTYYGRNGYIGKLRKTYQILPYDIQRDQGKIKYDGSLQAVYAKGGSKPKPRITFEGKAMKEGVDYTLSYQNNQVVSGNRQPCVVVSGKGCFKGRLSIPFTIKAQELSLMTLASGDRVYRDKANIYRITPKLMDLDGKLLSAGRDFDPKSITYVYESNVALENRISKTAGSVVEKTDIIPADTQIRITLSCGNGGNYTGTFTGTYRITKADINKAKVTIPKQIYTGDEIRPDKSQMTVKISGTVLEPDDYEIVCYDNNVKKGNASVTIRGQGNYGGTKTVRFAIGAKGFSWWWNK